MIHISELFTIQVKVRLEMNQNGVKSTRHSYTVEDVENGRAQVERGSSIRQAAKDNGVPFETLRRFVADDKPVTLKVLFRYPMSIYCICRPYESIDSIWIA